MSLVHLLGISRVEVTTDVYPRLDNPVRWTVGRLFRLSFGIPVASVQVVVIRSFQRIRSEHFSAEGRTDLWSGLEPARVRDRVLPVRWYFRARRFPKRHFYSSMHRQSIEKPLTLVGRRVTD